MLSSSACLSLPKFPSAGSHRGRSPGAFTCAWDGECLGMGNGKRPFPGCLSSAGRGCALCEGRVPGMSCGTAFPGAGGCLGALGTAWAPPAPRGWGAGISTRAGHGWAALWRAGGEDRAGNLCGRSRETAAHEAEPLLGWHGGTKKAARPKLRPPWWARRRKVLAPRSRCCSGRTCGGCSGCREFPRL